MRRPKWTYRPQNAPHTPRRTPAPQPAMTPTEAAVDFARKLEICAVKIRACAELLDSSDRELAAGAYARLTPLGMSVADELVTFGQRLQARDSAR